MLDSLLGLAGPVLGGLLGSKGSSQSQTTQNTIDPRFAEYLYGNNGILPMAQQWYGKNMSGMNDQMAQGMNNQWNALGAAQPGYQQMANLGLGLMNQPIAGNPFFSGGGAAPSAPAVGGGSGGAPSAGPFSGGNPQQMTPYVRPQAPAAAAPAAGDVPGGPGWGNDNGAFGNGYAGNGGGLQGLMNGPLGYAVGSVANLFDPRTNYAPVVDGAWGAVGNDGGFGGQAGYGGVDGAGSAGFGGKAGGWGI